MTAPPPPPRRLHGQPFCHTWRQVAALKPTVQAVVPHRRTARLPNKDMVSHAIQEVGGRGWGNSAGDDFHRPALRTVGVVVRMHDLTMQEKHSTAHDVMLARVVLPLPAINFLSQCLCLPSASKVLFLRMYCDGGLDAVRLYARRLR